MRQNNSFIYCSDCKFWIIAEDLAKGEFGECVRYAPQGIAQGECVIPHHGTWPITYRDSFCGDAVEYNPTQEEKEQEEREELIQQKQDLDDWLDGKTDKTDLCVNS